jgi:hypothetical protein
MQLFSKHPNTVLLCLLLMLWAIGLALIPEKGVSWDENTQRTTGLMSFNYVFNNDDSLLSYKDKDYGVAFELPLIIIEKAADLKSYREIFLLRHFVTYSFFIIGLFFLYRIFLQLDIPFSIAIIGVLLMLLSPRIFSHSMYNTKDIPFMTTYIIAYYYALLCLKHFSWPRMIGLAIVSGCLMNLRIMGVLLPLSFLACYILQQFLSQPRLTHPLAATLKLTSFSVLTALTVIITWPYLWQAPLDNFLTAFSNMSKFRWEHNILFQGEVINATEIPWHYAITWFAITTPLWTLTLGLSAIVFLLGTFVKNALDQKLNAKDLFTLLLIGGFIGPLSAVILFDSVLYDGWRQLFFIYPSFIILATILLAKLCKSQAKKAILLISYASLFITTLQMCLLYPFNQIYFNPLVSKKDQYISHNYEQDYWGNGYYQALTTIAQHDQRKQIKIAFNNYSGLINYYFLPESIQQRFIVEQSIATDYYLDNFRAATSKPYTPAKPNDYDIKVQGSSIYRISKSDHANGVFVGPR